MRILITSSATPTSRTGVTAHYNRLLTHMAGRVDSIKLLTPADTPPWLKVWFGAGRRVAKWLGPNTQIMFLELENFLSIWAMLRMQGAKSIDLVHAQDATTGAAAALALAGKVPVVMTCHFNDSPVAEYQEMAPLSSRTVKRLSAWYNYVFQKQDAIITVSEYTRQKAARLHPEHIITKVIHNGVVFSPLMPRQESDSLVIMNTGTLEERKNQRLLIDAAYEMHRRGFTRFKLWLLGDGAKRAEWQQLVADRNLTDHVFFLGFQSNVSEYLQRASLYVHTAKNESWGYAITEAIAAGTPVLTLNTGGIPEQFDEQKSGLLPLNTTALDLADAILRYKAAADRQRLARQQWTYAHNRFQLDHVIENHLGFYKTIIDGRKTASAPEPAFSQNDELSRLTAKL